MGTCNANKGQTGRVNQVLKLKAEEINRSKECFNAQKNGWYWDQYYMKKYNKRHISVVPKSGDIQITGPDTVYQGDEVQLQCVAGPSHPGQDNFISKTSLPLTSSETIIEWTVADNMKVTNNDSTLYLPGSDDLRKITRSSLRVKVKDIWQSSK